MFEIVSETGQGPPAKLQRGIWEKAIWTDQMSGKCLSRTNSHVLAQRLLHSRGKRPQLISTKQVDFLERTLLAQSTSETARCRAPQSGVPRGDDHWPPAELTGHRDTGQNTNYLPEAAAGLNQSARTDQPSMLCDHQPTADDLEHHFPGITQSTTQILNRKPRRGQTYTKNF